VNEPTEPTLPADLPAGEAALRLRERLLRLAAFLTTSRAGFAGHRAALAAFVTYNNRSHSSAVLVSLLENCERCSDLIAREVARAGVELATQAFEAAVEAAPELGDAGAKS